MTPLNVSNFIEPQAVFCFRISTKLPAIFLLAALVTLAPQKAFSESVSAPEKLEYAYPDVSVWTTKRYGNGRLKNPLVCIADYIFEKAGIPWHPKDYPANRLFDNLRTGKSKFSMLVDAPQLRSCCLKSQKPVAVVDLRVFWKMGAPAVAKKEDLRGKKVIAILGYSYAGLTKFIKNPENQVKVNWTVTHKSAFGMLELGRGDYVIDYAKPAEEILATLPNLNVTSKSLSTKEVFLVLNKQYPNSRSTMTKLEEIFSTLHLADFADCWNRILSTN